jgi:hypothetical protein
VRDPVLEEGAVARVQQDGHRRRVASDGFAIATFTCAPPRAGDPKLHTHCLIPNVVRREDGVRDCVRSRATLRRHAVEVAAGDSKPWTARAKSVVLFETDVGWRFAVHNEAGILDGRLSEVTTSDPMIAKAHMMGLLHSTSRYLYEATWTSDKPGWWSAELVVRATKPELEDSAWGPIDELLFAGRRVEAIAALRDETGCALRDALPAIGDRFEHLAREYEDRFSVPLETYWSGFSS